MEGKRLVINQAWCKGCGICAAFCPRNVLAVEKGKAVIREKEKCVFCGQCEQRCPDYAVYIDVREEAVKQWVKPC